MAIAGRVAIVPKGDWSADATYKRLDAVTYNNTLYFAKKDVPAGTATTNTEYWSKSIVGNPDKSSDQQGQNLISYPYYSKSNTNNGITWTVNDDGTVTANGKATKESAFNIISPFDAKSRKTLELNQKYVLSDGTSDKTKAYTQFVRFNASKNTYDYGINSRTGYNTWTASDENLLSYGIRLIVANGATVNNVVFKPMLEIGTVMHEYQPTTISNTTLGEKVDSFKQYEPDGKSMSVDDSGTLSINLDGTTITLDEAKNVIKLADTLKDKINGAFPAANLINNLTTTEAGFGLDARQGKALDDKITEIKNGSLKIPVLTCDSNTTAVNVQDFVLSNLKSDQLSVMRVFNNAVSEQVKNMGFGEYGNFFIIAMSRESYYVLIVVNHWDGKVWTITCSSYTWNWHFLGPN